MCKEVQNMFSGKAENYFASRPSYPKEIIDCLYGKHGLSKASVVADVGAGTGKFSKLMLERGTAVYCVEPNADMRAYAKKELRAYDDFRLVDGTAENTCLAANSVDCVTVAQAFHWFDVEKFKKECLRILKPNGEVVLVWNVRTLSAKINEEWSGVFLRYCKNFVGFSNGIGTDSAKITSFFGGDYCREEFNFPVVYDRQGFIKRSLSSSYSLTAKDDDYSHYLNELNKLFDEYQVGGVLTVPNMCVAFVGNVK